LQRTSRSGADDRIASEPDSHDQRAMTNGTIRRPAQCRASPSSAKSTYGPQERSHPDGFVSTPISYLVQAGKRGADRHQITEALWPDQPVKQDGNYLRAGMTHAWQWLGR
jgi:hypothetical protein